MGGGVVIQSEPGFDSMVEHWHTFHRFVCDASVGMRFLPSRVKATMMTTENSPKDNRTALWPPWSSASSSRWLGLSSLSTYSGH